MLGKLPTPSTYTLLTIPVPIIIWGKPARTGSKLESGIEGDFNSWRNWNQFKHNCTRVFTTEMRNRKLGELKRAVPTSDAWRTLKKGREWLWKGGQDVPSAQQIYLDICALHPQTMQILEMILTLLWGLK